jgi:hypothetical protein
MKKNIFALALAVLFLTSCGQQPGFRNPTGPQTLRPEDRPFHLSQFERIYGTRYLRAEINETRSGEYFSSSSGGNGKTRNLVFLDGESLVSNRLFDTNAYVIVSIREYPAHDNSSNSAPSGNVVPTQWLVCLVVKADTNGDGHLDGSDQQIMGITDPSGMGFTEILSGIEDNLGMTMMAAGQMLVVYSRGGIKNASLIDLGNRKVVSTKPLVDLGPDVK